MLRRAGPGLYPVVADAAALPFRDRRFDLVLAAFCLNHLGHPATRPAEARRVAAAIAASTFAPGWTHPAKGAVDGAAGRRSGYRAPAWYAVAARHAGHAAGDPDALAGGHCGGLH